MSPIWALVSIFSKNVSDCYIKTYDADQSRTVVFSYDFVYDMHSQLKQTSIKKNGSPYRNAEYNYLNDGNLDSRAINSSTTSFTYAGDLMDTASGGESFDLDFDDNGNMTTGVSQTFDFNWDNKLRSAPALSTNMKYTHQATASARTLL